MIKNCLERHKNSPEWLVIISFMKIFTVRLITKNTTEFMLICVNNYLCFLSNDFCLLKILIIESSCNKINVFLAKTNIISFPINLFPKLYV